MAEKIQLVNITPFMIAFTRRRANESIVTFFTPVDPHRLPAFIHFVSNAYRKQPPHIYIYFDFRGLFKFVGFDESGAPRYQPVAMTTGSNNPLAAAVAAAGGARIRDLQAALAYLDNMMTSEQRVVVVFWNPILSDAEKLMFSKFLSAYIYDYAAYARKHWIVVFTDDPLSVADKRVVENSIVIDMEPSKQEERETLLKMIAQQLGVDASDEEIRRFAEALRGLTLHQVETVALRSIYERKRFDLDIMTSLKYDIIRKTAGGVVEIIKPKYGFEAVGGYNIVKQFIIDNFVKVLRMAERAKRLGVRLPRGILFFGPPGTGKTWLAMALAKELGLPFMKTNAGMLRSKWYGETARNVKRLRDVAEAVAPAVLFIDEIDQIAPARGSLGEHEETRAALGVLLEWLGDAERKTIIVAATNKPEDLDEALIRSGRFDYIIPMLYPDVEARRSILEVQARVVQKVPLAKDVDFAEIAKRTELWTSAELAELVQRAARRAFKDGSDVVKMEHFLEALETFKINWQMRQKQLERYLQLAEEYTNDAEFLAEIKKLYTGVATTRTTTEGGEEEW